MGALLFAFAEAIRVMPSGPPPTSRPRPMATRTQPPMGAGHTVRPQPRTTPRTKPRPSAATSHPALLDRQTPHPAPPTVMTPGSTPTGTEPPEHRHQQQAGHQQPARLWPHHHPPIDLPRGGLWAESGSTPGRASENQSLALGEAAWPSLLGAVGESSPLGDAGETPVAGDVSESPAVGVEVLVADSVASTSVL